VNDNFKELKQRIRRLDELRIARGMHDLAFVRALDTVRRAAKHEDTGRDPSRALRALLEKAEALASVVTG